jgi:O-methyltransferase domain/Dimerisation domain
MEERMVTVTPVEIQHLQKVAPPPDPTQLLLQIGTGYVLSSALWVAAELNVADLLRGGPKAVAELAKSTKTNEDALYRILRLLAMVGIFMEAGSRSFALTPAAERLRTDDPHTLRDGIVWIADPFHFNIAGELMHSVRTGQPTIEHVSGKKVFDYFPTNPVEFDRFHRAMTNLSAMAIMPILEVYDFSPFHTVVDVAGGHGFVICEILRKYPAMKGILFDLEDVVQGGEHRICQLALDGRCCTAAGDFFQSVPEGGDLYVMKSIIHDWDDQWALKILANCRRALEGQPQGKLLLMEFVVPEGNEPHPAKVIDIEMLFFPGGRERTEAEYGKLLAQAGFRMTRIVPTQSPFSVVEAEVE